MPNSVFIILAVLMVIAAVAIVVVPLFRRGDQSPVTVGAVVALVPLGVAMLYASFSNWQWDVSQQLPPGQQAHNDQAASLADVATRLEQRLETTPDDVEGWQMLGRTYVVLSRYPEAVDAYGKARELSDDQDVNALTGYAEALAMTRGGAMDSEIGELFEQALLLSPNDRKALWYGGVAAIEQGRAELARSRWEQLLTLNPPEQMVELLREKIAAANAALGDSPVTTPAETAGDEEVGEGLALKVAIAPELAGRAHPDAPLFILARQVGVPGPPLAAVRKRVADLPLELVLSDENSMVAGQTLSAYASVEVVARISLGGTPAAQTGDLSGSKTVSSSGSATILIDSVVGN